MQEKPDTEAKKSQNAVLSNLIFSGHYRVSIMVALISFVSIALFALIGYQLDLYLGTKPILMFLGALISFPFAQVVIYRWITTRYIKKNNRSTHTYE